GVSRRSVRGLGTGLGWLPRAWARSAEPPSSPSLSVIRSVSASFSASRFLLLRHHAIFSSAFPPKCESSAVHGFDVGIPSWLKLAGFTLLRALPSYALPRAAA